MQVRQFFKDGKLEVLCSSPYDCDEQILKLGHKLPVPDAADPLSATLPYGGWRATITSENTGADRKTVEAKPVTMGMCMEQDKVKPGILFTTFHFPENMVNNITSSVCDGDTMCPEYKVVAADVEKLQQRQSA